MSSSFLEAKRPSDIWGVGPKRPCKIACSAPIADVGVQTPQGSLLFFVDNRQLSYRMGAL